MAIGALSIWYCESDSESLRERPDEGKTTHYVQALAYHGRSLRLHHQQTSLHDTSFLAVLLLFFDLLRGNRKAAMAHVNHGLALVLALMTDKDSDENKCLAPNPSRFFIELADVFADIATQSRVVIQGRIGHCPPLPNFAKGLRDKKQTLDSFMVLLSRQFLSSPSASDHIPAVFRDLDQFENCLNTALQQEFAIGPIVMEIIQASGILESSDPLLIQNSYPKIRSHPKIKEYGEKIKHSMQRLGDAFLPLFNKILVSDFDNPAYLRAIYLRLRYLQVQLFADYACPMQVESVHELTPSFREYLSLVEIATRKMKEAGAGNPARQLSLQRHITYYVLIIALFCRDPVARDQAIGILADYPGQDGLWNTQALYATALKARMVERATAVEGTPNEQWQRLLRREFVFEDGGTRILFRFLAKDKISGAWQLTEEVADVSGGLEGLQWVRQPLTGSGKLLYADLLTS